MTLTVLSGFQVLRIVTGHQVPGIQMHISDLQMLKAKSYREPALKTPETGNR